MYHFILQFFSRTPGFACTIYSLTIYVFSTKILILEHTQAHNSYKYSFSFSQISGNKSARRFGICITPNRVFLTNLGKLKTLESHNSLPRRPSWRAQQQSSRTGYPSIEQGRRPRWPAMQLQRASYQEGSAGLQEDMFLSSVCFQLERKEQSALPKHCLPTQHFSATVGRGYVSNNKCQKRNKSFMRFRRPQLKQIVDYRKTAQVLLLYFKRHNIIDVRSFKTNCFCT